MIIGTTLGIPDMLFILALMFFAVWKTGWIRLILSICIIIWGVFALPYDIKIAAPLVGIGTMLFIMATMTLIGQYRQGREEA